MKTLARVSPHGRLLRLGRSDAVESPELRARSPILGAKGWKSGLEFGLHRLVLLPAPGSRLWTASLRPCVLAALSFFFALPAVAAPAAVAAREADEKIVAAVRAADDERIAATTAADRARLAASYSDDLHYAHSNGKSDNKTSLMEAIVGGAAPYEGFDYKERTFLPVAPGIVLVKGRVLVQMRPKGEKVSLDLSYLAVWREEQGRWRFLAWQSCKNPPATEAAKK